MHCRTCHHDTPEGCRLNLVIWPYGGGYVLMLIQRIKQLQRQSADRLTGETNDY